MNLSSGFERSRRRFSNAGSWDALGVHYQSSGSGGSWADGEVTELVKRHNAKA